MPRLNIEAWPAKPPTVERMPDGAYIIEWREIPLAVIVTIETLQDLVSRAMVAQIAAAD